MNKSIQHFNPVSTPLLKGINLIEASAGTGKTYAIAMLFLRFIVENQVDVKNILVVTFTKAATEELKDRIRNRLVACRTAIINQQNTDDNLQAWLQSLTIDSKLIIHRLNNALLDIDQAGIFTIHGFCQRVLSEHALESGQLFDTELTGDISTIKQAVADDFWRKQVTIRTSREAALLTTFFQTPEQLLASVDFITNELIIFPDYQDLDQKFSHLNQLVDTYKNDIILSLNTIEKVLDQGKFKKSFSDQFYNTQQIIVDWLQLDSTLPPDLSLFTDQGILETLNGVKFKTSKKNPLASDEQKQLYISELNISSHAFSQLNMAIKDITLYFRRALLQNLQQEVSKKLEKLNILSFDDLITRFSDALKTPLSSKLCQEIQQQYEVALIDEFQDTDQNQWFIFSTLFRSDQHALYLIGDPKQAIYKFRGADINSYFAAQKQADHQFTLAKNWRSHPLLVTAINALFVKQNPFYSKQLHFTPVEAAVSSEQGVLIENKQPLSPLVLWQLDKKDDKFWTAGKATSEIITATCNEILDLLQNQFYIQKDDKQSKIKAKDIAILVRTNTQAIAFLQVLNQSKITTVINSKESIFSSPEAFDLYILLQAVAQPTNLNFLKQALTLSWFKLDGQQLFNTLNDEIALDNYLLRFQNYYLSWLNNGLMAMMRQLINVENISLNLSAENQAERSITNLQHCIELIQQAAIDEHLGVNKTLDWLHKNITQAAKNHSSSDDQQLRLESDEDAVQIITMHSAKGLEYPIVFCPFLWQRGNRLNQESSMIKCFSNNQMIVDLGSEKFEHHRSLALEEELAEDLRVFYVAVTRAKYRCYINWADVRSKEKTNQSAMAYLLDFSDDDFYQQQFKLKYFSEQQPLAFEYRLLKTEQQLSRPYQTVNSTIHLEYQKRQRSLYSHWQMSSYTALSSLNITHDIPEIPDDKARETSTTDLDLDFSELPRGAHTGNVIHDLLENISFNTLSSHHDISVQRDISCKRYGLKTHTPELIDSLLRHTVNTTLSDNNESFCLSKLNGNYCLKEMPFYLSLKEMDAEKINDILISSPDYQALSEKSMCGYLTGFIDLICQHNGQYYVIDYKSNYLHNYQQQTLLNAMRDHNYGLQYWLYIVVLHQYLKQRLPDYNYQQHVGGIKYLFVRGMNENEINSGVYQVKPEFSKIEQLTELLIAADN